MVVFSKLLTKPGGGSVIHGGSGGSSSKVKAVGFSLRKSLNCLLFFLSVRNFRIESKREVYLPHAVKMCDLERSTGVGQWRQCVG